MNTFYKNLSVTSSKIIFSKNRELEEIALENMLFDALGTAPISKRALMDIQNRASGIKNLSAEFKQTLKEIVGDATFAAKHKIGSSEWTQYVRLQQVSLTVQRLEGAPHQTQKDKNRIDELINDAVTPFVNGCLSSSVQTGLRAVLPENITQRIEKEIHSLSVKKRPDSVSHDEELARQLDATLNSHVQIPFSRDQLDTIAQITGYGANTRVRVWADHLEIQAVAELLKEYGQPVKFIIHQKDISPNTVSTIGDGSTVVYLHLENGHYTVIPKDNPTIRTDHTQVPGDCFYDNVIHELNLTDERGNLLSAEKCRQQVKAHILANPQKYAPFVLNRNEYFTSNQPFSEILVNS